MVLAAYIEHCLTKRIQGIVRGFVREGSWEGQQVYGACLSNEAGFRGPYPAGGHEVRGAAATQRRLAGAVKEPIISQKSPRKEPY